MIFVFYPLFQFAVDGAGMASTFAPNVPLAFSILDYKALPVGYRIIGSLLGGLVAGKIMERYFPDN